MNTKNGIASLDSDVADVLEQCVDRFGNALFRFAFARTGQEAVAEELVQETFLAAIAGGKKFRNEATLSTWLFAILKNKVADHFRVQNRRVSEQPLDRTPDGQPSPSTYRDNPEALFEADEFWETFHGCVDRLPNKLAEVFILREINQHSPQEIRELLGIGATNLSMRLSRCRLALRECLNVRWFDQSNSTKS
ncbi:sigma-70 family RNA polymerase sigma factor [Rhodopirellula sp. MGV]|uniref:sigma-70 family RNA polymerase sigma factor n=1 Tax=Rhodopirellula sp. MGV TaxID=2023130 RepID=UPI0013047332|nr:sigma-70 family RNA polymerase sigma factor [Rhodopirellula sp. MGV]